MRDARSPRRQRWRRRSPASAAGWPSLAQPRAKLVQLLECLERAERIRLDLLELLAQRVRSHLDGQAQLLVRRLQRALSLQLGKNLPGTRDHTWWQARQRRNVDSVRAVGAAGHHPVQEPHRLSLFEHLDALVADARQGFRKRCQLVVVRGEQRAAAEAW